MTKKKEQIMEKIITEKKLKDLIELDNWCKDVGLEEYNAILENGRLAVIYKKKYFTKAKKFIEYKTEEHIG